MIRQVRFQIFEASVSFSYRFEFSGDHEVEIRAAGDNLHVDNGRFLAVPVKRFVDVLCVDGRPSGVPFGAATDFLAYALAPEENLAEQLAAKYLNEFGPIHTVLMKSKDELNMGIANRKNVKHLLEPAREMQQKYWVLISVCLCVV